MKRQRLQQHAVEDVEDRGRHANAERKRHERENGDEARTDQRARRDADLMKPTWHCQTLRGA
jgi:hypothetical protein